MSKPITLQWINHAQKMEARVMNIANPIASTAQITTAALLITSSAGRALVRIQPPMYTPSARMGTEPANDLAAPARGLRFEDKSDNGYQAPRNRGLHPEFDAFALTAATLCTQSLRAVGAKEDEINAELSRLKQEYRDTQCKDYVDDLLNASSTSTITAAQKKSWHLKREQCLQSNIHIVEVESECATQTLLSGNKELRQAYNQQKIGYMQSIQDFLQLAKNQLDDLLIEHQTAESTKSEEFLDRLSDISNNLSQGVGVPLVGFGFAKKCEASAPSAEPTLETTQTNKEIYCVQDNSPLNRFTQSLVDNSANRQQVNGQALAVLTPQDMQRLGIAEFRRETSDFMLGLSELALPALEQRASNQATASPLNMARKNTALDTQASKLAPKDEQQSSRNTSDLMRGLLIALGGVSVGALIPTLIKKLRPSTPLNNPGEVASNTRPGPPSQPQPTAIEPTQLAGAQEQVIELQPLDTQ